VADFEKASENASLRRSPNFGASLETSPLPEGKGKFKEETRKAPGRGKTATSRQGAERKRTIDVGAGKAGVEEGNKTCSLDGRKFNGPIGKSKKHA